MGCFLIVTEKDLAQFRSSQWNTEQNQELLSSVSKRYGAETIDLLLEIWNDYGYDQKTIADNLDVMKYVGDIENIDQVIESLMSDSESTRQGAEFQLSWIARHKDQVHGVEIPRSSRYNDAADIETVENGQKILNELKCFDFESTIYHGSLGQKSAEKQINQLERDLNMEGYDGVRLVFDSRTTIPAHYDAELRQGIVRLQEQYPGKSIELDFWK